MSVIAICQGTSNIYSTELSGTDEKVMITRDVSGNIFRVWRSLLAHADKTAFKRPMVIKATAGFEKIELQSTWSCSPCVEQTIPNITMKSRTTLETGPGALILTNVAGICIASVGRARYFVTLIVKASGNLNAFPMKTKTEAAESLRHLLKRVKKKTENMAKETLLIGGREYLE